MMAMAWLVACVVAFGLLAVATSRQQDVVFRRRLGAGASRAAQASGWVLMGVALAGCIAGRGWGLGLVAFSGYTSAGAALVYLALILKQRR